MDVISPVTSAFRSLEDAFNIIFSVAYEIWCIWVKIVYSFRLNYRWQTKALAVNNEGCLALFVSACKVFCQK